MDTELRKECVHEVKRVYHFCKLATVFSGRRKTDKKFASAVSQRKRMGHLLVLHLAPGERRPAEWKLRIFDHVVDAYDLSSFHEPLTMFALEYSIFGVKFVNDCALIFDTSNGSHYAEAREAGCRLIKQLIRGTTGIEMYQSLGEEWTKLQIRWNGEVGWQQLHAENGWGDNRCIWVSVSNTDTKKENGRWDISLQDTSAKEVQRVTKALRNGRPWLARRGGRGSRRTR